MSDEEEEVCECPAGIPAWVMTFADLMSLLMCFFVLLLSFAEMDALKFKRLAGELRQAFGVQTQIKADDPPKGTSVIAKHFSPSIPEPTPINEVRQKTSDLTKSSLEVLCQDEVTQQQERQGDNRQRGGYQHHAGDFFRLALVDDRKQIVGHRDRHTALQDDDGPNHAFEREELRHPEANGKSDCEPEQAQPDAAWQRRHLKPAQRATKCNELEWKSHTSEQLGRIVHPFRQGNIPRDHPDSDHRRP